MADCPRCTSDMERETDWRWVCPACGLVETVPVVSSRELDADDYRELRDIMTMVAELSIHIVQTYPNIPLVEQGKALQLYQQARDRAEYYDDRAGDQ